MVFLSLNIALNLEDTMAEKKKKEVCLTCKKYGLLPRLAKCECIKSHPFCELCQASWLACPQCVAVASSSSLNAAAPDFLPQEGNKSSMENEGYKVWFKDSGNKLSSSKQMSQSSDNLGARPKQRSPRVPAPGLESVDYSEYEVSHTDRRTEQPLFNMARSYNDHEFRGRPDPNYETLPQYADSQLSERDPGYEMVQPASNQQRRGRRDPDYETVTSEVKDPDYEVVSGPRGRVNSLDPGYETVPQKRDPGYESVKPPSSGLDPGYETVQTSRGQRSGPRSFPPEYESVSRDRDPGYESVGGFRDPGYETVPVNRATSLEPGYETLPERAPSSPSAPAPSSETVHSVVNKK